MNLERRNFKPGDKAKPSKKWLPDLLKSYKLDKEKVYTVSHAFSYNEGNSSNWNHSIKLEGLNTTFDASYFDLIEIEKCDGVGIVVKNEEAEYTGGSSSYYKVDVVNPTTSDKVYQAECNDIIEALGLTFTEGNIFKAVWRIAADRNGKKKKGNNSVYDAEKVVFFAERLLVQEKTK